MHQTFDTDDADGDGGGGAFGGGLGGMIGAGMGAMVMDDDAAASVSAVDGGANEGDVDEEEEDSILGRHERKYGPAITSYHCTPVFALTKALYAPNLPTAPLVQFCNLDVANVVDSCPRVVRHCRWHS